VCNLLGLYAGDDSDSDSDSSIQSAEDDQVDGDARGNVKTARSRIEDDLGMLVSYTSLIHRTSRQGDVSKAYEFEPSAAPDDNDKAQAIPLSTQFTSYAQATLQRIMGPENWVLLQRDRPNFTSRLVQTIIRRWKRLAYRLTRSEQQQTSIPASEMTVTLPIRRDVAPGSTLRAQPVSPDPHFTTSPGKITALSEARSGGSTLRPDMILSQPDKPAQSERTATVAVTSGLAYPSCPKMRRVNNTKVEYHCRYCDEYRIEACKIEGEMRTWQ
jgi:hypothetical protein